MDANQSDQGRLTSPRVWAQRQPLRFYDREVLPLMVYATRCMAALLQCPPKQLALVPNATTGARTDLECRVAAEAYFFFRPPGTNTALRALNLSPKDTVYIMNITYGAPLGACGTLPFSINMPVSCLW